MNPLNIQKSNHTNRRARKLLDLGRKEENKKIKNKKSREVCSENVRLNFKILTKQLIRVAITLLFWAGNNEFRIYFTLTYKKRGRTIHFDFLLSWKSSSRRIILM